MNAEFLKLFKNLLVWLAVGYILTGLVGSTWCAQEVFKGAAFFCVLFSLGTVYVLFIVPEILMTVALINKNREVVIASVVINMFYLLVLCGLARRPKVSWSRVPLRFQLALYRIKLPDY